MIDGLMHEYLLHCYPQDLTEAIKYVVSRKGRVLDYKQDGDWLSVRYLCDKEL